VFLYSYGPFPLCYSPVGEALSGVVMGGIVPVACYYAMTGELSRNAALCSVPVIITIALIMLTNNGCDVEKDLESGRLTLPARIGRANALKLHTAMFVIALVWAGAFILFLFPKGLWVLPLLCVWLIPAEYRLVKYGFLPENRVRSMAQSTTINIRLNSIYAAMILLSAIDVSYNVI